MKSKLVKALAIAAAAIAVQTSAFAQGTINFFTFNANPAFGQAFQAGGTIPLDSTYLGQLWGGTVNDPTTFQAIGTPLSFAGSSGYINGPTVTVPNGGAGATYFYQLRAWNSANGSTWAAGSAGPGQFGMSGTASLTLGGGTVTGPNANGFASFSLVPEPSTFALGALGIGALLAVRRRK